MSLAELIPFRRQPDLDLDLDPDFEQQYIEAIAYLNRRLTDEGKAKAANLGEIARIERALEQLRDEPEKPKRKARAA